ncbi:MAG: LLM class flavin-dependent oxidoreductase, partial [Actinomycetia bacterium]|nr:LLM class flavin-dependent oxidoreductase [Actinomycetes bacterium]
SFRLCGEVADGVILTAGTTADGVREARDLIDDGRRRAGRDTAPPVTVYMTASPDDPEVVAASVRAMAGAGADKVVLEPKPEDDPVAYVRFVAEQVAPLTAP